MAPVNPGDTATFNSSSVTSLFLSGDVTIDSMTFNSGADAFTIETNGNSFSFVGVGIVNNSAQTQTIINDFGGGTNFLNSSTAGNAAITNNGGGFTVFSDTSTAGNATITNSGGGVTGFEDTSTAGNATLIAKGGGLGGTIFFENDSTGGTARVEVFGNGTLDISVQCSGRDGGLN